LARQKLKASGKYADYPQHVGVRLSTIHLRADIFHQLKDGMKGIEGSIAVLFTKHDLGSILDLR
jgi:hypothetical protein